MTSIKPSTLFGRKGANSSMLLLISETDDLEYPASDVTIRKTTQQDRESRAVRLVLVTKQRAGRKF